MSASTFSHSIMFQEMDIYKSQYCARELKPEQGRR